MKARRNHALRSLGWVAPVVILAASCQAPPATVSDSAIAADTSITASDSITAPDSTSAPGSTSVPHANPTPDSTGAPAAAAVIRRYYQAINARQLRTAYELWGDAGAASGRSFAEFAAGFAETRHVLVEVGEPGQVGAAAGSRYIDIPVVIRAVTVAGREQKFEGSYTLQRAVVDGASPAQRRWHIYSAKITRIR